MHQDGGCGEPMIDSAITTRDHGTYDPGMNLSADHSGERLARVDPPMTTTTPRCGAPDAVPLGR